MEPIGLIVGFLAGVITTVVVASMGMMKRTGGADQHASPAKVQLRTAEDAQRLSKVWHLVWTWMFDEPGTDSREGTYNLRPVILPDNFDHGKGCIATYRWSQRRGAYMLDNQYRFLSQIEDNKGHELIQWYSQKAEKMEHRMSNPTCPDDQKPDGPGADGSWPNIAEMIDGVSIEEIMETNTQANTSVAPPPRVVITEEPSEKK